MFDVSKALANLNLPPYLFTDIVGTVRQLPNMRLLTLADATSIYEGDALEVLPKVLDKDTYAAISAVPAAVLPALIADWVKHSEATPGESEASSVSTGSTAGRSKRTSSGTTKSRTRKS